MSKKRKKIRMVHLRENLRYIYMHLDAEINKKLWLEILFMIILSLTIGGLTFLIVSGVINKTDIGTREYITYEESREYVREEILNLASELNSIGENEASIAEGEKKLENQIKHILDRQFYSDSEFYSSSQTYLVDSSGKIIYQEDLIESFNLIKVIQQVNETEIYNSEQQQFTAIYPVIINGAVYYLYNQTNLIPTYHVVTTELGSILGFMVSSAVMILIIFRLTRDKIAYIQYLSTCLGEISKGDLSYNIDVVGDDELAEVARSITHMEHELKYRIEEQIKLEQSKNELVTNVAHDLRTPLTSIIGYIGLLKNKGYRTEEEAKGFINIAYAKAEKLKIIIEDLFELAKLHQKAIHIETKSISLSNLLNQLIEELMPLMNDREIELESYITNKGMNVEADIPKLTRAFENIIENAIKYSPAKETIYIEAKVVGESVVVAVSNVSEKISEEEVEKFFRRFYRADQSRSSETGGSGLGLAIAKNIIELHGGSIKAKMNKDLISFMVVLPRDSYNKG